MSCSGGPTTPIWKKWSITATYSKPTSSAVRTTAARSAPKPSGPFGHVKFGICSPSFIAFSLAVSRPSSQRLVRIASRAPCAGARPARPTTRRPVQQVVGRCARRVGGAERADPTRDEHRRAAVLVEMTLRVAHLRSDVPAREVPAVDERVAVSMAEMEAHLVARDRTGDPCDQQDPQRNPGALAGGARNHHADFAGHHDVDRGCAPPR